MQRARTVAISALAFALLGAASPRTFNDCADCPPMVAIEPGRFEMGSPDAERLYYGVPADLARQETPHHPVTITHGFAIGRTEVTRDQYAAFVADTHRPQDAKGCSVLDRAHDAWVYRSGYSWDHPGVKSSGAHPVTCVSWNDATAYAAWLAQKTGQPYRLPSEAEWEYAARAGTGSAAPWGDSAEDACRNANIMNAATFADMGAPPSWRDRLMCSGTGTYVRAVASYAANAFGLYDMIGNVWEWAADCAHPDYVGAPADGSAWVEAVCDSHAIRGGAFHSAPYFARSAARGFGKKADHVSVAIGFRVARDMPPS